MRPFFALRPLVAAFATAGLGLPMVLHATLDPERIEEQLHEVAAWHLAHPPADVGLRWWHNAPFYDGLLAFAATTGEGRYLSAVMQIGEQVGWSLGDRPHHADDHAVGHAWLEIHALDRSREERLAPTRARLDWVIDHPVTDILRFGEVGYPRVTDRWSWCDALYMSPPTLARLAVLTGENRYLEFMEAEFRFTHEELWDAEHQLFYRDARFLGARTENDRPVFWSRGNGWVYGGLALTLEALPADASNRSFYEDLFRQMTTAIVAAQQPDGLWRPNLTDPEQVPMGESSGSAFFLYGLSWGIRQGLLDRDTFWPVIERGWSALAACIAPSGRVGYVQPVGFDPRDNIEPDSTHAYGAGAVLLAGSELLHLLGAAEPGGLAALYPEAQAELMAGNWIPRVAAYVVPRRADDVAWENDRIAFRAYGPALREATEDSGIDAWMKRVEDPIILRWYERHLAGEANYHEDTGEGYDAYKVGARRGCGGTALLVDGQLHTANTYKRASIMPSEPGSLRLLLEYEYPIDGALIHERKTITLHEGSHLGEARSHFRGNDRILKRMQVVVGLAHQSDDAEVLGEGPVLALADAIDGYALRTGIVLHRGFEPTSVVRLPAATAPGETLLACKLDEARTLQFAFGFAWERHAEVQDNAAWLGILEAARWPCSADPHK